MTKPDTRVFIAFDLAAGGSGDFFTLNDPVKGELDNTEFLLAGDILEDVTADVRSVSIRRGRSRQLEEFQAGNAVVELNNDQRKYDPAAGTAITPFGASMRPRKQVVVEANGERIFSGVVDDWDLIYSLNNDHIAAVESSDQFVSLAGQTIGRHTATSQTTGERIEAILDRPEIQFLGATDIDPGAATLQADIVSDESPANLLSYLQRVERAEPGALFISREGALTFRGRKALQRASSQVFADDGTGTPFSGIEVLYGSEELKNRTSVSIQGGGTATSVNQDSVDVYGFIDFDLQDTLLSDVAQAQLLADWLANTYAEPQIYVDALEVNTQGLTTAQVNEVLVLELGDVIEVKYTPSGIGDQIRAFAAIDSIEHSVTAGEHIIRFDLSQTVAGFVLDSEVFGVLDANKLAF